MTKTKAWAEALRLRTLPLSLSGILIGSFIAFSEGYTDYLIFTLALITTVLFQILSNLANDLGDSLKGTDNEQRIGPQRTVQSGRITIAEMKRAVVLTSILSLIPALLLIYFGTQQLPISMLYFYLLLALLCVLAAITYTIGKRAYGYSGMGDIMVFLFFGLVSVLGVYSLYSKQFDIRVLLPAASIGFLSTAVLNLNNMRDIENDARSGKRTLVVQIGARRAKMYHAFLIVAGIGMMAAYLIVVERPKAFLGLLPGILLIVHLFRVMSVKNPADFDPQLKVVALSTFAIALLTGLILL